MNDNKMTSTELRATWGLGGVFSLRMLGMFMVLPVLTTYGMSLKDATGQLIGIAIGVYGLTQALLQIPFGLLSDRLGRKPLIIGGLLIFIMGSIIAACSDSVWGIILGRALQGAGAISGAVMALLSDLTREQNRTKAMAFIGVSFGITFAIAMVSGPIITHEIGLHGLFWLIAALATTGIITTLLLVPDSRQHVVNRESAVVKQDLLRVLSHPPLLKLNTGILFLHALLMSTFIALPVQLEKAGFAIHQHWKVYLFTMLIAFAGVLPFIIYAELKRQMKRIFSLCVGLLLVAELTLWLAGYQFWILVAGVQMFFLAFNIMEALLPSLISKEAPPGFKGTAMGVYSTCQFLGVAMGGALGGWLLENAGGAASIFFAGMLLATLWLLISLTMREPPYLSSLRIVLNTAQAASVGPTEQRLIAHPGVRSVLWVAEENSMYVKIDNKVTTRQELELLIAEQY